MVAFFADFVNALHNQLTQLTDFQYALCDGAKKVMKPGNEQTLYMSNYIKTQLQTIILVFMEQTIIRSYQLEVSYCTNYSTKAPDLCKACHKLCL